MNIPTRRGKRPLTGSIPPHLQLSDHSPEEIHNHMANWALGALPATTPELREEPTHISVPSSRALWLDEDVDANPRAFMPPPGSREFAHLHADGSWHLVVDDDLVQKIVNANLGERHPWYHRGVLEVLVYAPRDHEVAEIVKTLIKASVDHASNGTVVPFSAQPSDTKVTS